MQKYVNTSAISDASFYLLKLDNKVSSSQHGDKKDLP